MIYRPFGTIKMAERRINKKLIRFVVARLKQLRADNDLTQETLGNDTGINIGRIERGVREPSLTTISELCKYFKISVSEFFEGYK